MERADHEDVHRLRIPRQWPGLLRRYVQLTKHLGHVYARNEHLQWSVHELTDARQRGLRRPYLLGSRWKAPTRSDEFAPPRVSQRAVIGFAKKNVRPAERMDEPISPARSRFQSFP